MLEDCIKLFGAFLLYKNVFIEYLTIFYKIIVNFNLVGNYETFLGKKTRGPSSHCLYNEVKKLGVILQLGVDRNDLTR